MIFEVLDKLYRVRAQGEDNQRNSYQSLEHVWQSQGQVDKNQKIIKIPRSEAASAKKASVKRTPKQIAKIKKAAKSRTKKAKASKAKRDAV